MPTARFDASTESVIACAFGVLNYCEEIAVPWFERWLAPAALVSDPDSPLRPPERIALREALEGRIDGARQRQCRRLLGVA
jgi:hypothetical protein